MSEARTRIAVVIVHYKTPGMLIDCLQTLAPELDAARDRVLVVDNASGAADVDALRPAISGNITLMESAKNLGFAGANNLAIRHVLDHGGADYYMLLNPDTLIRPGAVSTLLRFLETHPQAAAVGPRLEERDATPQQSAFGQVTPVSELVRGATMGPVSRLFKKHGVYGEIHDQPHPTHWLAGACVLMRSAMIERVGLLDDGYFMYFEEVDFFRRAARENARHGNLETWYEPAAHVVHLVGQASGIVRGKPKERKRLPAYWFESRHRYFRKHFGYAGMIGADMLWFGGHTLHSIRKLFTGVSHAAVAQKETTDLLRHSLRHALRPRSLT
jgi:GT2 family glycosyltransferase